jgi:hypothetical protein
MSHTCVLGSRIFKYNSKPLNIERFSQDFLSGCEGGYTNVLEY